MVLDKMKGGNAWLVYGQLRKGSPWVLTGEASEPADRSKTQGPVQDPVSHGLQCVDVKPANTRRTW